MSVSEKTARERLAVALYRAYHIEGNGVPSDKPFHHLETSLQGDYFAEADAAIEFFRTILTQAHNDNLILVGDPAAVRVHNDAIEQLTIDLGKALSK